MKEIILFKIFFQTQNIFIFKKVFEGLAIGIETDKSLVAGIALAVACHKWAEGLTLVQIYFFE